jgi:hypothetical protein
MIKDKITPQLKATLKSKVKGHEKEYPNNECDKIILERY